MSRHDIAAIWAFSRWLRTGVSFIGCESRWNGGPVIGGGCVDCLHATHEDDRGGVKVNGAAMLQFVGGIYESNQPWGFVFDSPYFNTNEVTVRGICTRDACSCVTSSCWCCACVVSLTTTPALRRHGGQRQHGDDVWQLLYVTGDLLPQGHRFVAGSGAMRSAQLPQRLQELYLLQQCDVGRGRPADRGERKPQPSLQPSPGM